MRLDILATYSRQRKKELKEDRETNYCFLTEALFRIIIEKANGIIEFILEKLFGGYGQGHAAAPSARLGSPKPQC